MGWPKLNTAFTIDVRHIHIADMCAHVPGPLPLYIALSWLFGVTKEHFGSKKGWRENSVLSLT